MSRGGLAAARWSEPEDYHITLVFAGQVEGAQYDAFVRALAMIEQHSFAVRLDGLDCFGRANPRSIHARVAASPALVQLQARHAAAARQVGIEVEHRKFMPHVTLARLNGVPSASVADYLGLRAGFLAGDMAPDFIADRFCLYSARTSRGGGPYVCEAEFALRPKERSKDRPEDRNREVPDKAAGNADGAGQP